MSRFTHLAAIVDEITATQPGSLVVIAGDLNAKVGTAMPLSTKAAGAMLQHNAACGTRKHQHISFERKQRHPDSDFSGKLLHDMCQATHLINLTGITSADSPAAASFISTNAGKAQKPSRIDHMLLSPSALQHLVQHRVLGHLLGSDHLPLQIVLSLSTRPAPSSSASQQQQATLQQIIPARTERRYSGTSQQWQTQQRLMSCASWRTLVKHQLKR
jgi:endonuclease/exonuclease/phosphatase family metal-dependent hydrolase